MTVQIGDVVGDYKVIDVAGSGGMGAVYKIEHVITKRIEAMKLLPSGLSTDPDQVQRFEREIQVQARLHHPNIAALYNALRDGHSIALVMEFVEGESLQRMLEAGPLPLKTALDYAGQVLSALAYAHEAGVIHRDVSPANIIITPERTAKLTDFGLARTATDPQLTTSGVPLGSPGYMSPEQIRGIDVDARTDIYAMGAVLHEMLTGIKLFDGDGAFAVMCAHMETLPAPPSARNPDVSPALDDVVRKALAKDPQMRFQSADEFRLALENAATSGRPVVVPIAPVPRPRVAPGSPRRTFRPSRAVVLLMAGVPALLVAVLCAIAFSPKAAPVQAHVPPPVRQRVEAAPPPAPVIPAPAEVAAAPVAPPELPLKPETPAPTPRTAAQTPARPPRRGPVKPAEPSYAIRISGGEVGPSPAIPVPSSSLAASRTVEPPPPLVPKPQPAIAPETHAEPAASAAPPEPEAGTQEAGPAKPPKAGNRFVKALGRINPFRKNAKDEAGDASKTPVKKD